MPDVRGALNEAWNLVSSYFYRKQFESLLCIQVLKFMKKVSIFLFYFISDSNKKKNRKNPRGKRYENR